AQSAERRSARRRLRLRHLQEFQPRLPAPPHEVRRAARAAPVVDAQPDPLHRAHGGRACSDRGRRLRGVRARPARPDRSARARRGARVSGHEVVRTRGGALAMRSLAAGEIMHPGVGPLREAELLYVAQSRLGERLRARTGELTLFDVGLGAGSNALAARAAAESAPATAARLSLVSFERDLGALTLALDHPAAFGLDGDAGAAARALLAGGEHTSARTSWRLRRGELLDALAREPSRAD